MRATIEDWASCVSYSKPRFVRSRRRRRRRGRRRRRRSRRRRRRRRRAATVCFPLISLMRPANRGFYRRIEISADETVAAIVCESNVRRGEEAPEPR